MFEIVMAIILVALVIAAIFAFIIGVKFNRMNMRW